MDDYGLWAHKIWHIFALRASRRYASQHLNDIAVSLLSLFTSRCCLCRGQVRLYREFLRARRPRSPSGDGYLPREYFFDGEGGPLPMITEELFQVLEMKVVTPLPTCAT
jgi:anaphase-promoting complex subunit 5